MDKIIEKIVKSANTPNSKEVLWLDMSAEQPVLKHFISGGWKAIAGGGSTITGVAISNIDPSTGQPDVGSNPVEYTMRAEYDKWYLALNVGVAAVYLPEAGQSEPKSFCCTMQFTSDTPSLAIVPSGNDIILMQEGFELEKGTYEFNFVSINSLWFITVTKFTDEPLTLTGGVAIIGNDFINAESDDSSDDNGGGGGGDLKRSVKQ